MFKEIIGWFNVEQWQVIGIISTVITLLVTAFTAIASIYFARKTLLQNNKMIEDSTRPFIVAYFTQLDDLGYFIIKNEGSSLAIIDSITCDYTFTKDECGIAEGNIFQGIKNSNLAPNHSLRLPVVSWKLKSKDFNFETTYHSTSHVYSENIHINIISDNPFPSMNKSVKDSEESLKQIYLVLNEMLKRKL